MKNAIKFVYNPLVITVKIYWDNLFVNICEFYCSAQHWEIPSAPKKEPEVQTFVCNMKNLFALISRLFSAAFIALSSTNLQAICWSNLLINSSASLVLFVALSRFSFSLCFLSLPHFCALIVYITGSWKCLCSTTFLSDREGADKNALKSEKASLKFK